MPMYESITRHMTFGGNKIQLGLVRIPTSCCYHKKTSARTRIGTLAYVSSSTPCYNIARTLRLHIPTQNRWMSCLSAGFDVIRTSTPGGMPSDYPGSSSSTTMIWPTPLGLWTRTLSSAGSTLYLHLDSVVPMSYWGHRSCSEKGRRPIPTTRMIGASTMLTCKFVFTS
jgi:hypothetical protein